MKKKKTENTNDRPRESKDYEQLAELILFCFTSFPAIDCKSKVGAVLRTLTFYQY